MSSRFSGQALLVLAAIGIGATNLSRADIFVMSQTAASESLSSTFQMDVGVFIMGQTTKASLNGQATVNPDIDFNRTFGTGYDTQRFRVDALWRITERHHLEFMYFTNGVSRTRAIDPGDPVKWGDYAFSGSVTGRSRLSVYELGYEYAFLKNPTLEVAADFAIHYTRVKLDLEGTATVTDASSNTTTVVNGAVKTASVPAPLPVLGLRAGWAFANNWLLDGQVQVLGFSYDQFHGHWWDVKAGVTYLFNKNIGLGLAYDSFMTNLDVRQTNFNGNLKLGYGGGLLFVRATF